MPGLVGRAGAGRKHDGIRRMAQHLVGRDRIVAHDVDGGGKRPEQMHQVPGEAVVIVDDENAGHGAPTFA